MHQFLVHNTGDSVGVAVVDVKGGETVQGVYLDSDEATPALVARDDVPLGHKLALVNLEEGANVIEYRTRVGLAARSIRQGDHVHIHNVRSARW